MSPNCSVENFHHEENMYKHNKQQFPFAFIPWHRCSYWMHLVFALINSARKTMRAPVSTDIPQKHRKAKAQWNCNRAQCCPCSSWWFHCCHGLRPPAGSCSTCRSRPSPWRSRSCPWLRTWPTGGTRWWWSCPGSTRTRGKTCGYFNCFNEALLVLIGLYVGSTAPLSTNFLRRALEGRELVENNCRVTKFRPFKPIGLYLAYFRMQMSSKCVWVGGHSEEKKMRLRLVGEIKFDRDLQKNRDIDLQDKKTRYWLACKRKQIERKRKTIIFLFSVSFLERNRRERERTGLSSSFPRAWHTLDFLIWFPYLPCLARTRDAGN